MKTNEKVRAELKKHGMYQWQLADLLGTTDVTLSKWFRHELSEERQNELISIIRRGATNENG